MNQVFKKKAVAASLVSALAVMGSGFVSVPGLVTMSVASANQFEGSILNSNLTAKTLLTTATGETSKVAISGLSIAEQGTAWTASGTAAGIRVTVPASLDLWASLVATTSTADVSGVADGGLTATSTSLRSALTVGTSYDILASQTNGTAGLLVITTTGTTGYALAGYTTAGLLTSMNNPATSTTTATSPANVGTRVSKFATGAAVTQNDKVGSITVNADGTITLVLALNGTATDILTLPTLYVTPTASAANGASAVISIADGQASGTTPLNVTNTSFTVANFSNALGYLASGYTTNNVTATVGRTPATAQIKAAAPATSAFTTNVDNKLTLALTGGATWSATPSLAASGPTAPTATLEADGTITLAFTNNENFANGDSFSIGGNAWLNTSAVAADTTVNLEIRPHATASIAGWSTVTVPVAKVLSKASTVTVRDTTSDGVDVIYTGRAAAAQSDTVRIAETIAGTLTSAGTVTMTLSNGALLNAAPTATVTGGDLTFSNGTSTRNATNTATTWVVNSASGTASTIDLSALNIDPTSATAGDLTATFTGTAGVAATVKLATLLDASTTSVSGSVPTPAVGQTFTLPDIVIKENKATALGGSKVMLALPNGLTFDPSITPTMTRNGTAVTPTYGYDTVNTAANRGVDFTLTASDASTGAYTYVIKGLRVNVPSTASSGPVYLQVAGTNDDGDTDLTSGTEFGSDSGAKVTKQTVKVADIGGATLPLPSVVTVPDQTKAVISGVQYTAAGNDQGKSGSVYAFIIYNGAVFFEAANGTWAAYTGTTPSAYFTGTLGTNTIDFNSTPLDLTPFKGAMFGVGYGVGLPGLSDPFKDMLTNNRFSVLYTVK